MLAVLTLFGIDLGAVATFIAAVVAIALGIGGVRGRSVKKRLDALELARSEAETYKATIIERDKTLAERDKTIVERDAEIDRLKMQLAERDKDIAQLKGRLDQFEKFMTSPQAILEAMKSQNEVMTQGFGTLAKEMSLMKKEFTQMRKEMKVA